MEVRGMRGGEGAREYMQGMKQPMRQHWSVGIEGVHLADARPSPASPARSSYPHTPHFSRSPAVSHGALTAGHAKHNHALALEQVVILLDICGENARGRRTGGWGRWRGGWEVSVGALDAQRRLTTTQHWSNDHDVSNSPASPYAACD